jgi:hypothetical protein
MTIPTQAFLSFLSAFVLALIGAFVGARLALRRTKTETVWRTKYEAYQRILMSIEDIRFWAEESYGDNFNLPTVSADALKEARKRYDEAKRTLWSFVRAGDLIACEEARLLLDEMMTELSREEYRDSEDPMADDDRWTAFATHTDNVRKIVGAAVPKLVLVAKKDLQ